MQWKNTSKQPQIPAGLPFIDIIYRWKDTGVMFVGKFTRTWGWEVGQHNLQNIEWHDGQPEPVNQPASGPLHFFKVKAFEKFPLETGAYHYMSNPDLKDIFCKQIFQKGEKVGMDYYLLLDNLIKPAPGIKEATSAILKSVDEWWDEEDHDDTFNKHLSDLIKKHWPCI